MFLQSAGRFEEALAACQTGIELDASSFACYINAGRAQIGMLRYHEAIVCFETAMKASNRHHFMVNLLIWAFCLSDQTEKAYILMSELKKRSATEYISGSTIGVSAAYLGDMDEAFEYLERAYKERDPILMMLKYEHWVPATLKQDPRYAGILQRINFPSTEVIYST